MTANQDKLVRYLATGILLPYKSVTIFLTFLGCYFYLRHTLQALTSHPTPYTQSCRAVEIGVCTKRARYILIQTYHYCRPSLTFYSPLPPPTLHTASFCCWPGFQLCSHSNKECKETLNGGKRGMVNNKYIYDKEAYHLPRGDAFF